MKKLFIILIMGLFPASTWGKKRPDDVNRRYRNVRDVMEKR